MDEIIGSFAETIGLYTGAWLFWLLTLGRLDCRGEPPDGIGGGLLALLGTGFWVLVVVLGQLALHHLLLLV